MSTTTSGTETPENLEAVETNVPAPETAAADSQGAIETSSEKPPEAEKPKPKDPERSDEFVDHFNRLVAEGMTEDAAAKDVLRIAKAMAAKQADRAMHLAENAAETINGALGRIGTTLSEGKENPLVTLQQIVEQVRILKNEHADNLERVEGRAGDEDSGSEEPGA